MKVGRDISRQLRNARSVSGWSAGGMTLVEILIVLSIIAIMAAVAIPSFSRMGLFSGNELRDSARELYALLRAAKINAATYRRDAGIAYADSDAEPGVYRAVAMVYQYPTSGEYLKRLYEDNGFDANDARPAGPKKEPWYMPVKETEGGFKLLPTGTCVLSPLGQNQGIKTIYVFPFSLIDPDDPTQDVAFPANIFEPTGRMNCDSASPELCRLYVGYTPDMNETQRTIILQLYRSTGRVATERDEG